MMKRTIPSTITGRRRLLKLARLLEVDARKKKGIKFDLDTFGHRAGKKPSVDCGTTACAMGLAALSGAFKRQGLKANIDQEFYSGKTMYLVTPAIGPHTDFNAAKKLFHIRSEEALWLFSPDYYNSPKKGASGELAVAKRIRDFVSGKASPKDLLSSRTMGGVVT